jgi:hypothetical protein
VDTVTKFYVSESGNDSNPGTKALPFKTVGRINTLMADGNIKRGNSVLFKCGDEFFGGINPPPAASPTGPVIHFGAYSKGRRPKISGYKVMNLSAGWTLHAAGVWKIDLTASSGTYTGNTSSTSTNIGHLLVNGQVFGGKKSLLSSLASAWDFFSDDTYLYVQATANPTTLATDIRASAGLNGFTPRHATSYEGLEFEGFAGHGFSVQNDNTTVGNVTIANCDIHHMGGGYQPSTANRYGNGGEVWIGASDVSIVGNLIHDCYDTGTTLQGPVNAGADSWSNVTLQHNTIWNCTQSFEVWAQGVAPAGGFKKVLFSENLCFDGGSSWGEQWRMDPVGNSCHLVAYAMELPTDIVVENNIFWRAHDNYLYTSSPLPVGFISRNNIIGLTAGQRLQGSRDASSGVTPTVSPQFETIEQADAWVAATGYEKGSIFVAVPEIAEGMDVSESIQFLSSHAATAPAMAKIAARAAGAARGDATDMRAVLDKLDVGLPASSTPLRPSMFYTAPFISDAAAGGVNGEALGVILHPARTARLSSISFEVIGAGSAGAVVRAAVYVFSDSQAPRFALSVDGGTVSATTTGVKTITLATDPPAGSTVMVMLAIQGAPATLPTLRMVNAASSPIVGHASAAAALASVAGGIKATVAGAFPTDMFLSSLSPAATSYKIAVGVPASS